MDVTISKERLKTLTACVTLLSRCGKDLCIVATHDGLTLSTMSAANTSFMKVKFTDSFFLSCSTGAQVNRNQRSVPASQFLFTSSQASPPPNIDAENPATAFMCKCSLKSVHSILRRQRQNCVSLRIYNEYVGGGKKGSSSNNEHTENESSSETDEDETNSAAFRPRRGRDSSTPKIGERMCLTFEYTFQEKIRVHHKLIVTDQNEVPFH